MSDNKINTELLSANMQIQGGYHLSGHLPSLLLFHYYRTQLSKLGTENCKVEAFLGVWGKTKRVNDHLLLEKRNTLPKTFFKAQLSTFLRTIKLTLQLHLQEDIYYLSNLQCALELSRGWHQLEWWFLLPGEEPSFANKYKKGKTFEYYQSNLLTDYVNLSI